MALLALTVLAYGFYIPQQGFYWDDWPSAWILRSDTYTINDFFSSDRPLLGMLYAALAKAMPASPLAWQVWSAAWRWLSAVALWWMLRMVWRGREQLSFLMAALYLVYPGFTHQPIALTYSFGFVILTALFVSFGATALAVRLPEKRKLYSALGVVTLLFSLVTEYFIMLELMRMAVIYVVVSEGSRLRRQRIRRTVRAYLPYLGVMALYFFWRFGVFHPARPGVGILALTEFGISPVDALAVAPRRVITSVTNTGALAWTQPFHSKAVDFSRGSFVGLSVVFGLLAAAVAAKTASLLPRHPESSIEEGQRRSERPPSPDQAKQFLVVGILGVIGGGIPAWLTARQAELGNTWDRYTIAGMAGAAILAVGAVSALKASPRATLTILSVIVGGAAMFHVQNSATYAEDWARQRELFWQMHWRIPSLQSDASVLLDPGSIIDARGYSMTAASADTTGVKPGADGRMPYWILMPADFEKLDRAVTTFPSGGLAERGFSTNTDPARLVVVVKPDKGCLRVLDPGRRELWPPSRTATAEAVRSNPGGAINPIGPEAAPTAMGPELVHNWCFAFEKVELALSQNDVNKAREISDQALAAELSPEAGEEWIPFAEAYLRTGEMARAQRLLGEAAKVSGSNAPLCAFADRAATDGAFTTEARAVARRACLGA